MAIISTKKYGLRLWERYSKCFQSLVTSTIGTLCVSLPYALNKQCVKPLERYAPNKGYALIRHVRLTTGLYGRTGFSLVCSGCNSTSHFTNCLQDSETPLHRACESGHTETVHLLLERGAEVDAKDKVSSFSITA